MKALSFFILALIAFQLEAHQWEFGFRVLQNGNYISNYSISVWTLNPTSRDVECIT